MGRGKGFTPEMIRRVGDLNAAGFGPAHIADKLDKSKSAVSKLLRKMRNEEPTNNYVGRPRLLTPADEEKIKEFVEANPAKSIEAYQEDIKTLTGKDLPWSTVQRCLNRFSKALKPGIFQKLTPCNIERRLLFARTILTRCNMKTGLRRPRKSPLPLDVNDIVFSDEKFFRLQEMRHTQNHRVRVPVAMKRPAAIAEGNHFDYKM